MIRLLPALIASTSALTLAACAIPNPPPKITYDREDFKPAAVETAPPMPVQVVEIPTVLPLPGQLQPPPGKVKPDIRPPTARVDAANRAATLEPTKYGYINAIQIYPFSEGALYQLYAAP